MRRCLVLLCIGIAHYLLLWEADILTTYALVGLLLLPFAHRSARTWLRAAAALASLAVLMLSAIVLLAHPRAGGPASGRPEKSEMAVAYSHGSYRDVVTYRARQSGVYLGRVVPLAPLTLALFLLGLWTGKTGIAQEPGLHRRLLRGVFAGGLLGGIVANGLVTVYASHLMSLPKLARLPVVAGYVLGGPLLGLAYLAGLALLLSTPGWQARLYWLATPGRMALTNYLLQSVICSTLFYGYGLGWYNHVRPVASLGLCLAIFLLQIALSSWWLRRYRYGPVEWLWRCLTYRHLLPLRAQAAIDPRAF